MKTIEQQASILLVDDNPANLLALESVLAPLGCNLVKAHSGEEALKCLLSEDFAVILLDVQMPGMDGFETATLIKKREKSRYMPIIFVTAINKEQHFVFQGYTSGAVDYISKPIDPAILTSKVAVFVELFEKSQEIKRQSELLREKNEHMQSDLNLARDIQQAFFLKQYPSFPHTVAPAESALRFCHRYIPTTTLGGDFFDILALSDTMVGVFICDVMGHGVRSALVTAMIRALVGERTTVAADPGQFLTQLNTHLMTNLEQMSTPMFASAFYMVADVASGRLGYSNAGHPSPLYARRAAGTVEQLLSDDEPSGPALGVFKDAVYETIWRKITADDLLVLFTDGLVEVEGGSGEYGEERLLSTVQRHLGLPSTQLFDALLDEIWQFGGQGEFEDDVCLVAIEVARLALTDGISKVADETS